MNELRTFFPINRFKTIDFKKTDWELLSLQSKVYRLRKETCYCDESDLETMEIYFNARGFIEKKIFKDRFSILYRYDEITSMPISVEVFNQSKFLKKINFNYDSLKNELQINCVNSVGEVVKKSNYFYNSYNQLIEENHLSEKENQSVIYEYDSNYRLVEQKKYEFNNLEVRNVFHYINEQNFLKFNYNWENKFISFEEHLINNNCKSKSIVIYNSRNKIIAQYSFEYDFHGNLIQKNKVEDAFRKTTVYNRYNYDNKENWFKSTKIMKGEIVEISSRKIKYLNDIL